MKRSVKKIALLVLALAATLALFCVTASATDGAATDAKAASGLSEMVAGLFSGTNLALLGVALAVALPCIGSAKGVATVGQAATGLLSEQPHMFGKCFPLMALPMTQGVYGLVASFLMRAMLGLFGNPEHLTTLPVAAGAYDLMASLPIALAGFFSAVRQGRVSAAGINLLSKRPAESGKAITSSALVETYAIFALLITLLLVFFSPFNA